MVVVFHDAQAKAANENALSQNFIEYGRRLADLVADLKANSAKRQGPAPQTRAQ
jgi:hypothetical protein